MVDKERSIGGTRNSCADHELGEYRYRFAGDTTKMLTSDEIASFVQNGYVAVRGCFSREVAHQWVSEGYARLGYDEHDTSTWAKTRVHMGSTKHVDVAEFAPNAYEALCQLLGGEDRVKLPMSWSDAFIFNLGDGADRPWSPPSASVPGWHKDGDFFRHFLDSPEQGLLPIVLWSDVHHQAGGTFAAIDSVPLVAKFLSEHPEGVPPNGFPVRAMIEQCRDFIEITGEAGDVFILHPYMLHASSQNVLMRTRVITNPPISLSEPMDFHRLDPADYSPVERVILNGIGVDHLDFQPTRERERIVPERVLRQQREAQMAAQ